MLVQFIIVLLVYSSKGSIPNATINYDATEIFSLNEAFMRASPSIFHQSQVLVCEMIDTCCPHIKPSLENYVDDATMGNSEALMNACIGSGDPRSFVATCPMTMQFVGLSQNKDFLKYANVLTTATQKLKLPNVSVRRPCSSDEAYATLCDWKKKNLIESCERKTLEFVAAHNDDDTYRTFVQDTKENIRILTNAIKTAFPSTTNVIETTTLVTRMRTVANKFSSTDATIRTMTNTLSSSASKQSFMWIFTIFLAISILEYSCEN